MSVKRILIADANTQSREAIREILGESWALTSTESLAAAVEQIGEHEFDVVLAHFHLPDSGGAELLNRVRIASPTTVRFLIAPESLREEVMCHVLGGHQFLAVPFDPATLKSAVERAIAADYGMTSSMRELISRIRTFPSIPSLYVEVVNALKDPNTTTARIGSIIAKDMAMTTRLVQVVNSAYFGFARKITDPTEAVGLLGFEAVKSLVMSIKLLSQYDKVKPVYFSIDNVWRHSTNVARTARLLALFETGDFDCAAHAYTAGLMHDLGKVILAANFEEQYRGAHNLARKQQIPLWEVEKEIFGATHGEIGAYLLHLWGMSEEIAQAAAFHHQPARPGGKGFTPLTAIHVANAFEYEEAAESEGLPVPGIDSEYLKSIGLAGRVDQWRQARQGPFAATPATHPRQTQPAAPAPRIARRPSANSPKPRFRIPGKQARQKIGLGIGALVVLAALLWIMNFEHSAIGPSRKTIAQGRPPAPAPQSPVAPPHPLAPKQSAPPTPPTNRLAAAPKPAPVPAPAPSPWDRLKVQAIFFFPHSPSALINGRLVRVGEVVEGCRVQNISHTSVTMEHQNLRRTFTLR